MIDRVSKRLLIVDDREENRFILRSLLDDHGYRISEAACGFDALAVLDQERFDLVLLDVNLPDISGLEVCRRIKSDERRHHVLVLGISAEFTSSDDRSVGLEMGADGYLAQPIQRRELLAAVGALLRLRDVERKLELSQQKVALAMAAADMGAWSIDLKSSLESRDANLNALLGFDPVPSTGPVDERLTMILDEDRETVRSCMARSIEQGSSYVCEYRVRGQCGERWMRDQGQLQHSPEGQVESMTGVSIDITDSKLDQLRLARQALDLQSVNEDLEHFAAMASHDLQAPLRLISSYLDLLSETEGERLSDAANGYLEKARDGAMRMSSLVHNLLAHARGGMERASLEQTSRYQAALEESLANLDEAIARSGAQVEAEGAPYTVAMPHHRLVQVLQNLIENAIKYHQGPGRPEIRVATRVDQEMLQVRVSDNGPGIDPDLAGRLFQPFQRGKTGVCGTGLGLSTCKRIVNAYGGDLMLLPPENGGTTFQFTLPLVPTT